MKRSAIQISLTDDERRTFLQSAMTIILVTDRRGRLPHAVPMWFIVDDDGTIYMTTYGASQKVLNARRDPRVALLVESGVKYEV
jgi:nitroimidazol reductase NimA-like FMN-containing flavoprotein (pyridoxamine 5'-phosphate oxidase superfamily)